VEVEFNKPSDERADQINKLYDCEYDSDFPFNLTTDEKINEDEDKGKEENKDKEENEEIDSTSDYYFCTSIYEILRRVISQASGPIFGSVGKIERRGYEPISSDKLSPHCKDDIFRGICNEFIQMNYSTKRICTIMFQKAEDKLKCDNVSKKTSSSDFCKELFSSSKLTEDKSQNKIEAKFGSVGKVERRDVNDKYEGICEVDSFKKICNEFVKNKKPKKEICKLLFSPDSDTYELGISKCLNRAKYV